MVSLNCNIYYYYYYYKFIIIIIIIYFLATCAVDAKAVNTFDNYTYNYKTLNDFHKVMDADYESDIDDKRHHVSVSVKDNQQTKVSETYSQPNTSIIQRGYEQYFLFSIKSFMKVKFNVPL